MESIGLPNANGDTVLRSSPATIRLLHSMEVLHFQMGTYRGEDGIPRFSGEWLVRNLDKWVMVP